jgi:hypothetical protein
MPIRPASIVIARICLTTCFVLALLLQPVSAQEAGLSGTFVNEAQSAATIEAAIEAAVAKMNFVKRPIARSRLKKTNTVHKRVTIATTSQEIAIAFDSNAPVRMPADGATAKWKREDGEVFDVSARWQGEKLVQTFKAEDGQRTNTFSLGADGTPLRLEVEIASPQLPEPLRYTLTFTRG